MNTCSLLSDVAYHDDNPYAEPLLVTPNSRILRFALRPGQVVREHTAPSSPVHLVVLKGKGRIAGEDGIEHDCGPNMLITFEPGEKHSLRALEEEFTLVAFLHGAPRS